MILDFIVGIDCNKMTQLVLYNTKEFSLGLFF